MVRRNGERYEHYAFASAQHNIERAMWGDVAAGSTGLIQSEVLLELDITLAQET